MLKSVIVKIDFKEGFSLIYIIKINYVLRGEYRDFDIINEHATIIYLYSVLRIILKLNGSSQ